MSKLISFPIHCVKSVRIWSFSGPYFPAFGNTFFHAVIIQGIDLLKHKLHTLTLYFLDQLPGNVLQKSYFEKFKQNPQKKSCRALLL